MARPRAGVARTQWPGAYRSKIGIGSPQSDRDSEIGSLSVPVSLVKCIMADSLYLSLWFRDSELEDLLPHALRAMQQFPHSKGFPGIAGVSVHPVSWNEPTILEQRYRPGITPQEAVLVAADLLHEDYAYAFEVNWDLWTPESPDG